MDTNGGRRETAPMEVARELLRGSYRATSILAGAVIVQITALAWLMISLAHDTGIDVITIPAVSWCIGFAVLATAVAMAAARLLLGRHLSALMTVAVLAGWSLLPGTLVLFPVSSYAGPILMLLLVAPVLLALLAFAAISYARPIAPGNPAWIVIAGWFTALSAAALASTVWRSRSPAPTQARAGPGAAKPRWLLRRSRRPA